MFILSNLGYSSYIFDKKLDYGCLYRTSVSFCVYPSYEGEMMAGFLWSIIVLLFVLWLLGFTLHVAGALIHLLLVVIGILVIVNLLLGRGARV